MTRPQLDAWPEEERKAFGNHLRGLIAKRNLKQEDVAKAVLVDRSTVTRRVQGETKERPDDAFLRRICVALQLDAAGCGELRALAGYRGRPDHRGAAPMSAGEPTGSPGGVATPLPSQQPITGPVAPPGRSQALPAYLLLLTVIGTVSVAITVALILAYAPMRTGNLPPPVPTPGPREAVTVCAQDLLVRARAESSAVVLGTLVRGEPFEVERYSASRAWAHGSARGGALHGWVQAQGNLGAPCPMPTPMPPPQTVTVCAQDLLVRAQADPSAPRLGTLVRGEPFEIERYSPTSEWALGVARDGQLRGWVLARYVGHSCPEPLS